jgi:hypothetical protein
MKVLVPMEEPQDPVRKRATFCFARFARPVDMPPALVMYMDEAQYFDIFTEPGSQVAHGGTEHSFFAGRFVANRHLPGAVPPNGDQNTIRLIQRLLRILGGYQAVIALVERKAKAREAVEKVEAFAV